MSGSAGERWEALRQGLSSGRPLVMGILNVTPDSFSDGGRYLDPAQALTRAAAMAAQGAVLVDIGAESTRPGHLAVEEAEELARLLPVLDALANTPAISVSVDTTKAAVARAALARGALVVNDQWGFQGDPAMADAVAEAGAIAVLMHNRMAIDAGLSIVDDMLRFFEASLAVAGRAGLPADRLVLDPGIGFGKTFEQQLEALHAISRLRAAFDCPVLVGVSRKSFLGRLTGSAVGNRLPETLAANLFAFERGARLFRVHDVAEHVAALRVAEALAGQGGAPA